MRVALVVLRWAVIPCILLAIACHDATGPIVPLSVALHLDLVGPTPVNSTSIVADGDSVIAQSVISVTGCSDYSATGHASPSEIVLTIVETATRRLCTASLTYGKAVVTARDVPPGFHFGVLVERHVALDGSIHEEELTRAMLGVR